jgi:glutathione S-transferase
LLNDGGEQYKDDYVKLNPSKEVPTLEIDGHAIGFVFLFCEYLENGFVSTQYMLRRRQSVAILEYLEETRPEHALLPKDPVARCVCFDVVINSLLLDFCKLQSNCSATVRQLVNIIASDTQPVQNLRVLQFGEAQGVDKMAWGKHFITLGFQGSSFVCTRLSVYRSSVFNNDWSNGVIWELPFRFHS